MGQAGRGRGRRRRGFRPTRRPDQAVESDRCIDVSLLPPTLTLQYQLMPKAKFSPHIGAGINWTLFFNQEKSTDITAVNYTNSVGPAFQAGLDMRVDDPWIFGFGFGFGYRF